MPSIDDYFELDENDRRSCEESIEAILSGKVEKVVENVVAVKEDTEDGVTVIDEPPF